MMKITRVLSDVVNVDNGKQPITKCKQGQRMNP